jgi:hypothetical protein
LPGGGGGEVANIVKIALFGRGRRETLNFADSIGEWRIQRAKLT